MKAYGCNSVYYTYWDRSHHILCSLAISPTVNIADISEVESPIITTSDNSHQKLYSPVEIREYVL